MGREFTYKISVDTESIQKAAQQVRSVFARTVSFNTPGALSTTVVQRVPQGMQIAPPVQPVLPQQAVARPAQPTFPQQTALQPTQPVLPQQAAKSLYGGALGTGISLIVAREVAQMALQVEQGAERFAEYSVNVQRTSRAFELLSGSSENAEAKLLAVQNASGGAIDKMQAMAIANRAGALGMAQTADELDRVTRFATIAGRVLGLDTASALENMAMAASNLSFVRLDQMGINASAVRKEFNELRKSMDDNRAFLEAMLRVGEETFAALDDRILTTASGVEVFRAGIADLKMELSGLGTALDEAFRFAGVQMGGGGTSELSRLVGDRRERLQANRWEQGIQNFQSLFADAPGMGNTASAQAQIAGLAKWETVIRNVDQAIRDGIPGASQWKEELMEIGRAALRGPLSEEQVGRIYTIEEAWGRAAFAVNTTARALDAAGASGERAADRIEGLARALERKAFWEANPELQALNQSGAFGPGLLAGQERTQADARRVVDENEGRKRLADAQFRYALSTEELTGQIELYQHQLAGLTEGTVDYLNTKTQLGSLERQLANEQAAAAKRVEAEWKAAAEKTAQEFENAIRKVPGLFGTSPVTQSQMERAAAGIPQRFPDSFLREMEDQVLNGVPRGINVQEVAKQAGIDPSLPEKLITQMFREMWESSELFANPENISRFVDLDAAREAVAKQGREAQGEKNLLNALRGQAGVFGFGAGTPDNLDAFLNQLTGENGVAAQVSKGMAEATAGVGDMGRVALAQFNDSNSLMQFYQIGKMSAGETFRGWAENIGSAPFAAAMAESIKQSIIEEFQEVFNGSR